MSLIQVNYFERTLYELQFALLQCFIFVIYETCSSSLKRLWRREICGTFLPVIFSFSRILVTGKIEMIRRLRNNTFKFFVTCAIISSTILIINIYRFLQFFCHCIGLVNHRNHLYQVFLQQQFICKNHQLILDYDFEETNIIFLSQNDIKERLFCWHCSDFKKTFKQLLTVSWNI